MAVVQATSFPKICAYMWKPETREQKTGFIWDLHKMDWKRERVSFTARKGLDRMNIIDGINFGTSGGLVIAFCQEIGRGNCRPIKRERLGQSNCVSLAQHIVFKALATDSNCPFNFGQRQFDLVEN
ncbi:MAG TPA: hypothetical protein VH280_18995 [Verrucomicrobiae bacterium]|nr:hypothetical protein [Verrucomicrobiae bacterium]